jgi:hypothetical protein
MEAGELLLAIASWTLVTFTLGALVAYRLEGRRPLAQPRWLVLLNILTFDVMAVSVVVTSDRPTGVIAIEPFWWTALHVVILGSALLLTALQLRELFVYLTIVAGHLGVGPFARSRDEAA